MNETHPKGEKNLFCKEFIMKKIVFLAVLAFVAFGVYALNNFTVQAVTGRVEKEVSPGKWVEVKEGEAISEGTVIRTGINSSLVLKSEAGTTVVKALQNGEAGILAGSAVASGIRLSGKVAEIDTSAVERATGKVSTASARASNAAEEAWEEE
jgi:hypothetical protein